MDALPRSASTASRWVSRFAAGTVSPDAVARWSNTAGRHDVVSPLDVAGRVLAILVELHHPHRPSARAQSREGIVGADSTMNGRIILAGGSGFLGRVLARELLSRGQEVMVLTRSPGNGQDGVNEVAWDGKTLGHWAKELDRAAAVINLAG